MLETGYIKPITATTRADPNVISDVLKRYHYVIKVKADIDQFLDGLKLLKINKYISRHLEIMKVLFVTDHDDTRLEITPGMFGACITSRNLHSIVSVSKHKSTMITLRNICKLT